MDNLGNMKSLENCQIVCNNTALVTRRCADNNCSVRSAILQPNRHRFSRYWERSSFVSYGSYCKYCDSRNRQSAVYFGLLLLLHVSLSVAPPLCPSMERAEAGFHVHSREKGRQGTRCHCSATLDGREFSFSYVLCLSPRARSPRF